MKLETQTGMVNGTAMVEEDSGQLVSGDSSSGSNNSGSAKHSPNKCILTNNKLEERKR